MVLRFQLNTICTCSLERRHVQRYTNFENYLDICGHAPDCIVRHYDIQGDSQCFSEQSCNLHRGFPEGRPVFSPLMGACFRRAFIWC